MRWGCWTAGWRHPHSARRAATTPSPARAERLWTSGSSPGKTCASSSTTLSREARRVSTDRPPETIREYLGQLQRALKGAAPGLIADALADCEEHLNNEIAQNPNLEERVVLASVIETYGTP